MNVRNRLLTILALLLSTSCMVEKGEVVIKLPGAKNFRNSEITKATVSNVQIINDQLVITGTNLNVVTNIKTENPTKTFSETFTIESKSSSQIIANSNSPLSFAVNSLFNLVLSNSYGAATFQINFSLCDATMNGKVIDCSIIANDKDVLSYDSNTDTWRPRQVNGLNYLGTFDASPGIAPVAQPSGSYYVISVPGTIGALNFDVGDWIVSNGSNYQKIDNSTTIISVFGRTGAVSGAEGDYSLDLLSDVDLITTPPSAGKILKYNGSQWVVSDDLSSGGAGSVSSSEIADGAIATSDLANLAVTDAKINSVAASKITGTLTGSQIASGVITNSHIAAGAAIDYSKLNITNGTIPYAHINVGAGEIAQDRIAGFSTAISNLLTGTIANGDTTHAPTADAVFDALGLKLNLTGGTLTGTTIVDNTTGFLEVPTPTNLNHATNKQYVDNLVTGATNTANEKVSKTGDTMSGNLTLETNLLLKGGSNYVTLRANAATANYTLSLPTTAGTAGYVLQTDGNGVLSWINPTTMSAGTSTVNSAAINDGTIVDADINNSANIAQSKIAGLTTDLSNKQPLDAGLTNLSSFNTNGLLVQSADNTFVGRSIAGTSNRVQVTNGDGVSGNPTIDINSALLPSPTVGGYFLKSTGADASAWSALTSGEITTALGFTPVNRSGDTISTGTIAFNAIGTLSLGYTPTNLTDATSKSYVDNLVATAANQWTESSGNIYRSAGNVGIGTSSPLSKLQVAIADNTDVVFGTKDDVQSNFRFLNKYIDGFNIIQAGINSADTTAKLKFTRMGTNANLADFRVFSDVSSFNGRLGIGAFSPITSFQVATPATTSNANTRVVFGNSNNDVMDVTGRTGDVYLDHVVSATYTATAPTTLNKAVTFKIDRAPDVTDVDLTVTKPLAFWVEAGDSLFGGKIGMGNDLPSYRLDIQGNNFSDSSIKLKRTEASGIGAGLDFYLATDTTNSATSQTIGNRGLGQINFYGTNETGVPAANPSARISAYTSELTTTTTTGGQIRFQVTPTGSNALTEMMRIVDNKVGMGSTSPKESLDIKSGHIFHTGGDLLHYFNAYYDSSVPAHKFAGYSGGSKYAGGVGFNPTTGLLYFSNTSATGAAGTNASINEKMVITKDGFVGIGTNAPTSILEIAPAINNGIRLTKSGDIWRDAWFGLSNSVGDGNEWLHIGGHTTGGNRRTAYFANTHYFTGSVGIGSLSPSRMLYVNGTSGGTNAWENLSDKRFKRNIATVDNALEKLLQLDGVEYFWNENAHSQFNVSKRKELGVIAQDVEQQFPEAVKTDEKGIKSVAYTMLISPMIEAIKTLYRDHIEVLWKNVNEHERKIASLKNENLQMKKDLHEIKKENRELRSAICEINPKSKVCN